MCWAEMMDPPHQGVMSSDPGEPGYTSPTCQGYSFTSVSVPPTILVALFATPQSQALGGDGGCKIGNGSKGKQAWHSVMHAEIIIAVCCNDRFIMNDNILKQRSFIWIILEQV